MSWQNAVHPLTGRMTPERDGGDDGKRQSGGSISRLFRALTRRGSADAVSKRLSFSPSKGKACARFELLAFFPLTCFF